MERVALSTLPHFLFISSLPIHYLYLKLSQNVEYGLFVANVKKNLTYALRENNSVRIFGLKMAKFGSKYAFGTWSEKKWDYVGKTPKRRTPSPPLFGNFHIFFTVF